jgi:hypothetical protein
MHNLLRPTLEENPNMKYGHRDMHMFQTFSTHVGIHTQSLSLSLSFSRPLSCTTAHNLSQTHANTHTHTHTHTHICARAHSLAHSLKINARTPSIFHAPVTSSQADKCIHTHTHSHIRTHSTHRLSPCSNRPSRPLQYTRGGRS